ncbi:GRIP1-associated protein 1 isoform X6 [Rhodamnia argentea]|uniref:FRIGIDA-like protein n=1 Tax=Rhodamnia argentea TaxID=178133 RepID=A0ABM3HLE9_9MYRT|nr:GRIP1-associated protein 1 isoform X6 [Rhodamnia argentea]
MVKSTSEELIRVQSLLDHSVKAHDDSERRLSILERTIKKRDKEVMLKAGKLQSIENRLNSCEVELKVKEEELKGFHKSMDERSKELESKESELLSVDILIEEHKEALKSKQEELEETNKFINERLAAVALKDRELGSIQTSIGKLSKNLKSKEGEMENMMKRVKQCNEEAESKKEDIAAVQAKLEEVAKSLEWKSKELNAVQASIKDRNLELASKRRWLESIQIDITKRAEQLRLKEKEYAFIQSSTLECSKALEFKKKQCSLGSTQQWQIKTEEPENFAALNADYSSVEYPPPPPILARNDLPLSHTELSNENAMICKEILHTLQNSSDPAKLVLDVIAGSCAQNSKDMNLQTHAMRSQIFLLEQLVRISPSITHEVKEGAMKLAREWKAKLSDRPESPLEVLAFQQFLAAYDLRSLFNDAPLLGQTLGLVNEITAPASIPASLSGGHQQPPREKKRSASDRAIDVQSQSWVRKCKSRMTDQGGPL